MKIEQLITRKELANDLGIDPKTLYLKIKAGEKEGVLNIDSTKLSPEEVKSIVKYYYSKAKKKKA